jgi:hypothetical protein
MLLTEMHDSIKKEFRRTVGSQNTTNEGQSIGCIVRFIRSASASASNRREKAQPSRR